MIFFFLLKKHPLSPGEFTLIFTKYALLQNLARWQELKDYAESCVAVRVQKGELPREGKIGFLV